MRRYAYIGMVVLLLALLAGCHGDGGQNAVETPDSVALPDTAEVSDSDSTQRPASVPLPDITQAPALPTVSGTTETPDSQKVADAAETPDSQKVPDSTETSVSATAPDTTQATDSPAVPDTAEAPDSGSTRTLTADELRTWSQFLCRADCNGFLMSSYSTPLQADLLFVFYTGAGVGESPSEEMVTDYLQANDFEEAYTDITFIPYDKANQVLERRTGYTLEHFKLAGNDIPMYYSQKYQGYFHMAGDTNYMPVECVSGRENPDGSLSLEVRESSEWSGDSACSFETTLKPDTTGQNMLFDQNTVTGGWLNWEED